MDLPRPALVTQMRLVLSPEGRQFAYLLADQASGKILRLTRAAAVSYERFAAAVLAARAGDPTARRPDEADARIGFSVLSMVRNLRDAERFGQRKFNPLMMSFNLFDAGPIQRHVGGLARVVFGLWGAALTVVLLAVVVTLGIRNDWAILAEFNDSFSLEAFLTFGLVSPFLKAIHEMGHILAATRCGVRVRKAGISLIGLFPIPSVDCSDADITVGRGARMLISAAGVLTDLVIGLVLFLAWHLVDSAFWTLVIGRAFVYNTLNSVLFNLNPLMRGDGYWVLADLLGRRNLGTEAQRHLTRALTSALGTYRGAERGWTRETVALAVYAAASWVYRISLTFSIVWSILPRFLGLGLVLGLWGAVVQVQAQLAAGGRVLSVAGPTPGAVPDRGAWRRPVLRLTAVGLVLLAVMFLPLPQTALIDLAPDVAGAHAVTVAQPGFVVTPPALRAGFSAGQAMVALQNPALQDALSNARMELDEARLTAQVARAKGAAGNQMGAERLINAETRLRLDGQALDDLVIRAPVAGELTLFAPLQPGQYLAAGTTIGQFLPQSATTTYVGLFPVAQVTAFYRGVTSAEIFDGQTYRAVPRNDLFLDEQMRSDAKAFVRGFTLRVQRAADEPPLASAAPQLRLQFAPIPVWQHLAEWMREMLARFRDAEIAERQKRIEGGG